MEDGGWRVWEKGRVGRERCTEAKTSRAIDSVQAFIDYGEWARLVKGATVVSALGHFW